VPQKVWIDTDLIDSPAFHSLTGYAPQLLITLFRKRRWDRLPKKKNQKRKYLCTNLDSLNIVYTEYLKKGISKGRLSQAIGQLLARGFITLIHHGGAFDKDKSVYALSDQWIIWNKRVTFEERPKIKVQRGFCKPKKITTQINRPTHSTIYRPTQGA